MSAASTTEISEDSPLGDACYVAVRAPAERYARIKLRAVLLASGWRRARMLHVLPVKEGEEVYIDQSYQNRLILHTGSLPSPCVCYSTTDLELTALRLHHLGIAFQYLGHKGNLDRFDLRVLSTASLEPKLRSLVPREADKTAAFPKRPLASEKPDEDTYSDFELPLIYGPLKTTKKKVDALGAALRVNGVVGILARDPHSPASVAVFSQKYVAPLRPAALVGMYLNDVCRGFADGMLPPLARSFQDPAGEGALPVEGKDEREARAEEDEDYAYELDVYTNLERIGHQSLPQNRKERIEFLREASAWKEQLRADEEAADHKSIPSIVDCPLPAGKGSYSESSDGSEWGVRGAMLRAIQQSEQLSGAAVGFRGGTDENLGLAIPSKDPARSRDFFRRLGYSTGKSVRSPLDVFVMTDGLGFVSIVSESFCQGLERPALIVNATMWEAAATRSRLWGVAAELSVEELQLNKAATEAKAAMWRIGAPEMIKAARSDKLRRSSSPGAAVQASDSQPSALEALSIGSDDEDVHGVHDGDMAARKSRGRRGSVDRQGSTGSAGSGSERQEQGHGTAARQSVAGRPVGIDPLVRAPPGTGAPGVELVLVGFTESPEGNGMSVWSQVQLFCVLFVVLSVLLLVMAELIGHAATGESLFAWMDQHIVPVVGDYMSQAVRFVGVEAAVDWMLRLVGYGGQADVDAAQAVGFDAAAGAEVGRGRLSGVAGAASFGYVPGRGMVRADGSHDDSEWQSGGARWEEL